MDTAIRRVRDIRLALGLLLSMAANLAPTMSFAQRKTVTVLVPATVGPAWEVGGGGVGRPHGRPRPGECLSRWPTLCPNTLTRQRTTPARVTDTHYKTSTPTCSEPPPRNHAAGKESSCSRTALVPAH